MDSIASGALSLHITKVDTLYQSLQMQANSIEKHGFIVTLVELNNIQHQILNLAREPYEVPRLSYLGGVSRIESMEIMALFHFSTTIVVMF